MRGEQAHEVIRFIDYWVGLTGQMPQSLYFDSKPTTFAELFGLDSLGVRFITIRSRESTLLKRLQTTWGGGSRSVTINIPKRDK